MEHGELELTGTADSGTDHLRTDWEAVEDRASKVWSVPLRRKVR